MIYCYSGGKMKNSAESIMWYDKINNLWESEGFPIRFDNRSGATEKVNFRIAKEIWRKAFRKEFPNFRGQLIFLKETSGNRYTNYERPVNNIKVQINTSKGWSDLVHDLGHCIHFYKNKYQRPHNATHATLEWRITKLVFEGDYIAKSRKAINKPKLKKNRVHANFEKLRNRQMGLLKKQKQYQTNLKRIETSLKEVDKKLCNYEKRYDSKTLSNKYIIEEEK